MSPLAPIPRLDVGPIAANASLRTLAYDALKKAITESLPPPKAKKGKKG